MAFGLNLNSGGGDFLRIVKFDARAGRVFRIDRDKDTGEQKQVDITDVFEGVFDFAYAATGWAWLQHGQAPDFVMVPVGEKIPAKPSKDHRQALRLRLMLSSTAAGGTERLREITLTANAALRGLEHLHDQWLAGCEHNPGKAVLARLAGVKPVASGSGGQKTTNYEPSFAVVKWVKTPAEFEQPPDRHGGAVASAEETNKAVREKLPPTKPPAGGDDDWG